VSINERPVEDQLDIVFLTEGETSRRFTVRRTGGEVVSRILSPGSFKRAKLVLEEMEFERCHSRCIFCFVDQMPNGLRPSLYEKDDDYRLSFLFGNYITLNDIGKRDIERILALHLSPLYISVHAIDRRVRERLFGRRLRRDIKKTIDTLARGGVTIHAQVVLVPGINDGAVLDETIEELFAFFPAVRSVAVVPVGLTDHRAGLPVIEPATERSARALIRWAEKKRESFEYKTGGERFLYLSDEWYLLARRVLPSYEAYGEFWQIANGVGICRRFIESVEHDAEKLRNRAAPPFGMTIVTGALGGRFMRRYVVPLLASRLPACRLQLLVVRNRLFGNRVGVSGLLAGRDIIRTFRRRGKATSCLVLPPNAVNHDGLLIDDLSPGDIGLELGVPVLMPEDTFLEDHVVRACGGSER
jgi:putative radical SAM enzyme (TIGR03279 family)